MGDSDKACLIICYGVFSFAMWCLIVAIGSVSVEKYQDYDLFANSGGQQLAGLYNMGRDWRQPFYTELKVTDEYYCEDGWEPVYERIFYGMDVGCDCLGINDRYITTDNQFTRGVSCDNNQTRAGCAIAQPFTTLRMHRVDNKHICGRLSSQSFLNAQLQEWDGQAYQCPSGFEPCIEGGLPEDTICIEEGVDKALNCPITDINFVTKATDPSTVPNGDVVISFNDKYDIVFSKQRKQLPVTSLKIGPQPCSDPFRQANTPERKANFYATEIYQDGCDSSGFDLRFYESGLEMNEGDFMSQNGLYDVLSSRTSFVNYVNFGALSTQSDFKSWNRPSWGWSIECENQGKTRQEAIEKTKIQVALSYHEKHVYNCGLAIVIMFPVIMCCSIVCGCCTKGASFLCVAVCVRFIWIIMGPIMLTSLNKVIEAADFNKSISSEFQITNECADVRAYVDSASLNSQQDENIEKAENIQNMTWAAFGFIFFELGLALMACCCVMVGSQSRDCSSKCRLRINIFEELKYYLSLYKDGG